MLLCRRYIWIHVTTTITNTAQTEAEAHPRICRLLYVLSILWPLLLRHG